LTTISIILHNNLIKDYEVSFDKKFLLFLYKLIFYLIKCIKKYKDSKEAILYIIDIFSSIVGNNNLKLNDEICELFFDEFNIITQINDFKENKNLISLFQKFSDKLTNNINDITNEKNKILAQKETKIIRALKNNYSSRFDSILILIDEYKYYNKLLFELYLNNNDNNIGKLLLEKIYTILININNNENDLFKIFINQLFDTLIKLNSNFQKYFTLFYIIVQYISK
jgi:hypothetical protein